MLDRQVAQLVRSLCSPRPDPGIADFGLDRLREAVAHAEGHGLAPLLACALNRMDAGFSLVESAESGSSAETVLARAYLQTLGHNLRVKAALRELDVELAALGLSGVLWKGGHLIHGVYPDPGMRPMEDVDILVPARYRPGFETALSNLGYRPGAGHPGLWRNRNVVVDMAGDAVNSDRIPARLAVIPLTAETVRDRARPLPGYSSLLVPCPVDTVVLLAVHAMKHGFARDIWLADGIWFLDRLGDACPPAEVSRRAIGTGSTLAVGTWLALMRQWPRCDSLWPGYTATPEKQGMLAGSLVRRTLEQGPSADLGELFFLASCTTWKQRTAYVKDTLLPPRATIEQLYPGGLFPWWARYPRRTLDLARMGFYAARARSGPGSGE
ncbi:MAG: nucleotidyltransferase family protein [Desulfatibacillaceae bacterium]